jgi:3-deoxy-manno-octulosonate cytidylyltransferase (CMP-KDO synthetase)
MRILGIIPARYGSTRFPGKPLTIIAGKTMVQRVFEQASKSGLTDVVVATDDQRIFDAVSAFGGKAMMTSATHQCGTDRCLEVVENCEENFDAIINIQGDEPFIDPTQIQQIADCFRNENPQIVTLAKKINDNKSLNDENIVKVSISQNQTANTFLRVIESEEEQFKHIGIYGFKTNVLREICTLDPTENEQKLRLEQLRWLDNGYSIHVKETFLEAISIDTPEDLKKINPL